MTEPYIPDDRKPDVIREARWHLAGYVAIAALSLAAQVGRPSLWLLPMLVMKPVHQLQNTIEHLGLPHVDAITENTRTTRTNALMRWMCWNMQYHTAHHAFPGVPCYRCPGCIRRFSSPAAASRPPCRISRFSAPCCGRSGTAAPRPTIPMTRSGSATTPICNRSPRASGKADAG